MIITGRTDSNSNNESFVVLGFEKVGNGTFLSEDCQNRSGQMM